MDAAGVAFLVGAASLVQEVLWVRLAGFATGGLPETFATILALYLLGIAVGAQLGRRLCVGRVLDIRRRASLVLLLSALVDIAAPFLFSWGSVSSRDCRNAASGDRNRCAEERIVPGGAPSGQQ
ncbi:hypothetical protein FDU21_21965 [Xanthomonas oryzae pv. oryzae]|nr:hypothetical protein FDU21_21965 [Xanthomonas oryzae pv. oryzae]